MICMHQHPVPNTRTPEKPCRWQAEAIVDGTSHTAQSRSGAAHELARTLVGAGIADQPVTVHTAGIAGHAAYRRCTGWPNRPSLRAARHR